MVHSIKTKDFEMEYIESEIGHPVLWERHCHAQYEMIAVAAMQVSYDNYSYFYRLYHKHFGKRPDKKNNQADLQ